MKLNVATYKKVPFSGHETKAMLNNGGPRYKRSTLEKQMNEDVLWCVLILIILCMIGAIGCKLWLNSFDELKEPFQEHEPSLEAFIAFLTFIIILQVKFFIKYSFPFCEFCILKKVFRNFVY